MTGHYGPEEWWYPDGTSAANVSAVVFEGDQSTLAAIYSDAGLTAPLANPTTTDGIGMLEFYAVDGSYWIFVGDENYGDSVLANLSPPVTGTGGALLIANNLSDLSNVVTARTNLGLGTAALANTGVGPTNVILGNDARLTDARTPTAHAATHATVGSDPVSPASIGAQPIATIDAKGDLYAGTADNATARRSVGTDGQVLVADSTDPTGLSWSTTGPDANAQSRLVIDAKGDLYAGTGNDATTRLPVGTNGQSLRANSALGTGLEWVTLTAGDVGADPAGAAAAAQAASQPLDSDLTSIAGLTPNNDDIIQRKAGAWTNRSVAQYKVDQAYTASEVGAVPTARNLTAGIALSGGGDLSVDRTFDVDLGTTAGTAAEGNDTRITGAQQRSTLITKGDLYAATASATATRLPVGSDGQTLRANSATSTGLDWHTLTAGDVGADPSGAAAAAQAASQPLDSDLTAIAGLSPSNDDIIQRKAGVWVNRTMAQVKTDLAITASDVGAQPISTIDAKGDLYVGTGDNATTRRAVGTNGQVLTADSAQSDGVKWATPASGGAAPGAIVPRAAFIQAGGVTTVRSSKTATLNVMFLVPICLLSAATLSTITFEVSSSVGSATVRLGVYAADAATFLPTGAAIADFGTFTADTASTAGRACVVSQLLPVGVSWIAIVGQGVAPTLRHCAGFNPFVSSAAFPGGTGTGWNNSYAQTSVSGALPSIGSFSDSDSPLLGLKF